jgi:hypothetical protein
MTWLGERDHEGVDELRDLVGDTHPVIEIPLVEDEPTDLESLAKLGELAEHNLEAEISSSSRETS